MAHHPGRPRPCPGDGHRVLLAVASRAALLTALLLGVWALVPAALGWQVTTVLSDSMRPAVRTGDVVSTMPTDAATVRPGQVLLVDDPDRAGRLRLHRLQRVEPDGTLRLRGDANPQPDRSTVVASAVHGIGVLRFPLVGLPSTWIRTGEWGALLATAAAAAVLLLATRADREVRRGAPCRRCGTPRWTTADAVASDDGSAAAIALPVAAIAVALVTATGAGAVFTGTTGTAAALATADRFACFVRPLDAPVLAWDFDEARGPVVDRSGAGADGTLVEDVERNHAPCGGNPSVHLGDRSASPRVTTTTPVAAPSTFSVEAWFRTDRAGGRIVGFSSEQSAASARKDRHLYVTHDGRLAFGVQGSNEFRYAVTSAGRVDDGQWHHAVGTFTTRDQRVFVDGVQVAARTDNFGPRAYDGFWRVGRESLDPWPNQPTDYAFRGDVDTVRVYDRVLDPATVAAHHAAGR